MSQHDLNIANQTASATRSDINNALAALGSTNSGTTEPPNSPNNMLWYDTATHILKLKAEAGADWINIGYFDQGTDTFKILDDTVVITAAGAATNGIIGDQTTGTWQAGTGTTESLVSPAKVKASVIANAPVTSMLVGDVGTYIFGRRAGSFSAQATFSAGTTYPGTTLYPAGISGNVASPTLYWATSSSTMYGGSTLSSALSGTWRAMGSTSTTVGASENPVTLFVRIS
tara:strand:- start:661 stop:1350 length:690 start_codon:yes stop_codon:yes gene_type:complete